MDCIIPRDKDSPRADDRRRGVKAVFTRYHPDLRAPKKRAFIPADIGAARRGLNVLARACSGAMFPRA